MRGHLGALSLATSVLIPLISGCREELGPERFETSRVSGTVRASGRSADRDWKGWIEFIPVDGTVGKVRSAPIRPDGSFEADQVAVGWNQIGLVNAPISPHQATLFHPFNSANPIRRKIPQRGSTIEIDLYLEELQNQTSVTRRR